MANISKHDDYPAWCGNNGKKNPNAQKLTFRLIISNSLKERISLLVDIWNVKPPKELAIKTIQSTQPNPTLKSSEVFSSLPGRQTFSKICLKRIFQRGIGLGFRSLKMPSMNLEEPRSVAAGRQSLRINFFTAVLLLAFYATNECFRVDVFVLLFMQKVSLVVVFFCDLEIFIHDCDWGSGDAFHVPMCFRSASPVLSWSALFWTPHGLVWMPLELFYRCDRCV